ncbi:glutamate racemase [Virgibacillus pantothenticus]|uniref:Glutamate racemase n=1 Tax=Virgibacillus pantothenticus TaxID=1473 RepID=A0A0L0QR22_VIRPA|nr:MULTISPECIES: glutamate racemase [Virgibacillus]API90708.1 glutamate racemase [Virgibacillus sp. 6R]KNE20658.1 glutamate racemase [Virgibacillus pantothenticus]MBS7427691.1 glutamate racemase [Virgibacillus sp. 19R1-5]MBU8566179.1 glutamate racemase [Virgibacillus pantothenticus]MBU8600525.1 glutamate racemase [Virgibacillus pantothenticus]
MKRAIGVIDSGVGGLTVVSELMRQLPKEKLIYVGDTARCPYGPRSKEEVQQFTWEMVDFLLEKDIKMLVVACNTATAFTLDSLKKHLSIPVIGVIQPGARAAIKFTKNNCIGIIGTEGTIRSHAYTDALKNIKAELDIYAKACPMFVPMVEQGIMEGPKAIQVVKEALLPMMKQKQMDTLILGCTHYPLLKSTIQSVVGTNVTLISSSEETARETSTILEMQHLLNHTEVFPIHQFYTTGDLEMFMQISERIFKERNLQMITIKKAVLHQMQDSK